ncbi:MAG: RagB/SusD family nutrient uptake outer membrane protein [Segetibacter sp.]|nr:RagB/SusD family nutrient uptake outer membrane protein [Segetibacter sp.]
MNLKKLYKTFLPLLLISALQYSCKKYETEPLEALTEDIVFDKMDSVGTYADRALTNLYTFLPTGFNRIDNSFLDAATDDAVSSEQANNIEILSQAYQSPTQTIDDNFANAYTGIYRANLFLSKIDVVPFQKADVRQYYKSEARFIRAMLYFELVKRYGGVPLLGDKALTLNDNLSIPRNTFQQCVDFIVSECDATSGLLRKDSVTAVETGRITRGVALALKSRMLLYAASPMNNPANDLTKWQAAANAAKAVIDLNYYALNASFVTAFTSRASNKEVILAFQQPTSSNLERALAPVGYQNLNNSSGLISPTEDLVRAFPTLTGLAITDPASGYNPATPYANRDPRFNATIFYNGSLWLNRPVETFEGGRDKPGGIQTQTKTGYYLRKFLPDLSTASNYSAVDHNFIIFRYAEVLLNYAEAVNEMENTVANRTIAYAQLTALRKRAGITAGANALYGLKANMTQAEMRDAIKLERRIELTFEEHRFWDVRRWKTAETDFNKILKGVSITKTSTGAFTYQTIDVAPIRFIAPKMYLYPLPYSELLKNKALTQNPGW